MRNNENSSAKQSVAAGFSLCPSAGWIVVKERKMQRAGVAIEVRQHLQIMHTDLNCGSCPQLRVGGVALD